MDSPFTFSLACEAGEGFLSATFRSLLDRLKLNLWRVDNKAAKILTKLSESMLSISDFLDDAENKQYKSSAVKKWLRMLRDAVYDLDDLVDEIATRHNSKPKSQNLRTWKRNFLPRKMPTSRSYGKGVMSKIKVLVTSFGNIERGAERLGLVKQIKWNENDLESIIVYRRDKNRDASHDRTFSDESLSLLVEHAFGHESAKVARCVSLPITEKALARILHLKPGVGDWKAMLGNNMEDNLSSLSLSNCRLSANLKACFAYCSIFPKGYEFDKEKLVRLWMAEGFLHEQSKNRREEDAGDDYFHDLFSRSFFRYSSTKKSRFVMHDHVSDFAQIVSKEFCLRLEDGTSHMSEKIRHASSTRGNNDPSEKLKLLLGANRLRTLLMLDSTLDYEPCHLRQDELKHLFSKLSHLRVLSLASYVITDLPSSICKLKHLRYLDLSHTQLETLPESVSSLYNLQTLDLSNCDSLMQLPQGMSELVNLRHLLITGTNVQSMPLGMSRLTNLQNLSNFFVGKDGSKVSELTKLSDIRGTLSISKLRNFNPDSDALNEKLKGMRYLDGLELEWSLETGDPTNDEKALIYLEPSKSLKKLAIESYCGTIFPYWLGDSSFSDLVFLSLSNCKECLQFPPLVNLPSLQVLVIKGLSRVTTLGEDFYGMYSFKNQPFRSLKILMFERMLAWEKWATDETEDGKFPLLNELHIIDCPNLKGHVPKRLPSLEKLVISKCPILADSVPLRTTPAKYDVWIDGTKIQPRSEDEDPSAACPGNGPISGLTDEFSFQTASESPMHVASQSSLQMTRTADADVAHQVDDPAKVFSYLLQQLKDSDAPRLDKWPHTIGISSHTEDIASQDSGTDDQAKIFASSSEISEDASELSHKSQFSTFAQEVSSPSSLQMTRTADVTHQADDQTKAEVSSLSEEVGSRTAWDRTTSAVREIAIETTFTSHDIPLQFSSQITRTTADNSTYQTDTENKPCLRQDELQFQYSSPGIFRVSDISELSKLQTHQNSVRIEGGDTLESFPSEILSRNPFLQHLYIVDCVSLISFAEESSHPTTMKTLHFRNCKNLNFHFTSDMLHRFPDLEHLSIGSSCDSLESFPLDFFPNLKILCLRDCMNLNTLTIQKTISLYSLDALEIRDCPKLVAFPPEGLLAPNLTSILLCNCKNLKSLPRQMRRLESLQSLYISNCQELESLPKDGLPASLNLLCITSCDKINLGKELGLNNLDELSHLEIEGGCVNMESFPEKGLLPGNLISLRISRLLNLRVLDQDGLQELACLENLEISSCKKLRALPEELPYSLCSVSIKECPLLKAKLLNKRGTDWSRIAHIPNIFLDEEDSH